MTDDILGSVRHSYATKDDVANPGWSDTVRRGQIKRCSVADLLDWCAMHELDPASVEVAGGGITYHQRETADERDSRLASIANASARHEQWERDTYARLREKFDSVSQSP